MNKNKFIAIDIGMMFFITIAIEVGLYIFAKNIDIFQSGFTLTFVVNLYLSISLLVMYRWNKLGVLFAFLSTIVYLLISLVILPVKTYTSIEIFETCLVYFGGVLFFGLNLIWFKIIDKEKLRSRKTWTILYVITGFILAVLGRSLVASIIQLVQQIEFNPVSIFLVHLSHEMLNIVFGIVMFLLIRNQKELFVDMNTYLLYMARKREEINKGRSQEHENNYK